MLPKYMQFPRNFDYYLPFIQIESYSPKAFHLSQLKVELQVKGEVSLKLE